MRQNHGFHGSSVNITRVFKTDKLQLAFVRTSLILANCNLPLKTALCILERRFCSMTKAKRLNPTWDTRRQLFLLSMNRCAFPNCTHNIIDQNGHFIGEICHIEAANEEGERFNPNQSNEDRRHISNLLLMCPTHHKITNNVAIYDVNAMRKIKSDHESKAFSDNSIYRLSDIFVDQEFGG